MGSTAEIKGDGVVLLEKGEEQIQFGRALVLFLDHSNNFHWVHMGFLLRCRIR